METKKLLSEFQILKMMCKFVCRIYTLLTTNMGNIYVLPVFHNGKSVRLTYIFVLISIVSLITYYF